jgi:hypothetical protein
LIIKFDYIPLSVFVKGDKQAVFGSLKNWAFNPGLFFGNYSLTTMHPIRFVLPLEKELKKQVLAGYVAPASTCFLKDFPSPVGFLANGGGDRGGGLSNYIFRIDLTGFQNL